MNKSYEENLPGGYFGDFLTKVTNLLIKGENVCVSAMRGCGRKTFLNYFLKDAKDKGLFESYYLFDPVSNKEKLTKFVKNVIKQDIRRKLFVINIFENIKNKNETLEEIQLLRQPNPFNNVFLIFTDQSGIIDNSDYLATTSPFFGGRFNLNPFSKEQTFKMIDVNNIFYGWNIPNAVKNDIFILSGGIPRLIKHISREIAENSTSVSNFSQLIVNPSIAFQLEEMSKIIYSTDKSMLEILGIVNQGGKFKSKLLEYYFKHKKDKLAIEIYPYLTDLESKVFSCLYENKDKTVSIDQIGDFLEMSGFDFSLWAVYKLISRLKYKIRVNFEIENLKGKGYKLKLIQQI